GVHPPVDVAESYERVVNALEQAETKIRQAQRDAIETELKSAGDNYQQIYDAIQTEIAAGGDGGTTKRRADAEAERATERVEKLLQSKSGGDARKIVELGAQYFYGKVTAEVAKAQLFKVQRFAFEKAPRFFTLRAYLRAMMDALDNRRIYLIAVKNPDRVLYQIDLKPPPPLEVLQQEVKNFQESGGR